jgi:hypothetical protein
MKLSYCIKCGTKLNEDAKFCSSCGAPVTIKNDLRTEEMKFSDFTTVEVGWAFRVIITQSSTYSVIITADETLFDDIQVTKTGDTLKVGLKSDLLTGLRSRSLLSKERRVEITMPNLYELDMSGATRGVVKGFSSSHQFVLDLSGASSLEMVDMSVGDVKINLSGASRLNAKGVAKDLLMTASGASRSDLADFPVHGADVNLSGASETTVNLVGVLDANVSGASHLKYLGEPTLGTIKTSGAANVSKK